MYHQTRTTTMKTKLKITEEQLLELFTDDVDTANNEEEIKEAFCKWFFDESMDADLTLEERVAIKKYNL